MSGGSFSVICGTILLCPRASAELDESRTVVKDREIAVGLGWAVADGMVLPMSSFDKMWGGLGGRSQHFLFFFAMWDRFKQHLMLK